ncbi:MAG: GNAT family N-acetyltransferase [Opitutales bacterium]|nr:GNAT family N-acetyltransferase [Opitutales bacterium]
MGVAVLSEPGEGYTTPELDAKWETASAIMGKVGMERFNKYGGLCDETIPEGPYHYLGILGVLPKCQGQGVGRQLLERVLEEANNHPESLGVCLNTETDKNLPFYRKSGFEVFRDIPVDTIHTWGMVWEKDSNTTSLR